MPIELYLQSEKRGDQIHTQSNMSACVLLNLLELRKRDKMPGLPSNLFRNQFKNLIQDQEC